MKKILFTVLAMAVQQFAPSFVQAQGTLYVSNLGVTSEGSKAVGSDSWFAELFSTGTDSGGYILNSVQLLMDTASGSPSGFTVALYSYSSTEPGSSLGDLSGSDPAAGGVFTYTASNIILLPSTFYWIVVTSATPIASGSYNWSLADTINYSSSDGWEIGSYDESSNGSEWAEPRSNPLQYGVYATAVPEPVTYALGAMGALLLGCHRWRNSSR